MNRPSLQSQQSGPIIYQPARKIESEEDKIHRYERVIEKLRKMLEHERRQLKGARVQYNKEMGSKTELEHLLREAVEKVKRERKR
jgi:predicted RNase H-like nuclease (RuvC/YqgF family)